MSPSVESEDDPSTLMPQSHGPFTTAKGETGPSQFIAIYSESRVCGVRSMASDHRQGKCKSVWYKISMENLHVSSFPIPRSVGQSADDTMQDSGSFYDSTHDELRKDGHPFGGPLYGAQSLAAARLHAATMHQLCCLPTSYSCNI